MATFKNHKKRPSTNHMHMMVPPGCLAFCPGGFAFLQSGPDTVGCFLFPFFGEGVPFKSNYPKTGMATGGPGFLIVPSRPKSVECSGYSQTNICHDHTQLFRLCFPEPIVSNYPKREAPRHVFCWPFSGCHIGDVALRPTSIEPRAMARELKTASTIVQSGISRNGFWRYCRWTTSST